MTPLLDANVLIALVVAEHQHHDRARAWVGGLDTVAVAPVVEGALLRFLIRSGESTQTATAVLAALHRSSRVKFWEDTISYVTVDLGHVVGHRQVTDAYLAGLALAHRSRLATFDRALAAALPHATVLVA